MITEKARPPLRYPGSKFRAYKYIAPYVNQIEHDEYREPFFGSGAVFFQKQTSQYSWINDLDSDLINFYQVIQNKELALKLANLVKDVEPSKEFFEKLKLYTPETAFEKAYKYFVINRTAYSGIMNLPNWGFHKVKSVQPDKWPARIIEASEKIENAKITSTSYEEIIFAPKQGNRVLLFLDPPYYAADQKRAYVKSFTYEDHIKLADNLRSVPYDFILTYDNCPEINKLYSWANINNVEFMYHTANSQVTTRKKGKELIITNFNLVHSPKVKIEHPVQIELF